MRPTDIVALFRQTLSGIFKGEPDPEKVLNQVLCELVRRGFEMESFESFGCPGIRGKLAIFPEVHVNLSVDENGDDMHGGIHLDREKEYLKVARIFGQKKVARIVNFRSYPLSEIPSEIARLVTADALELGKLLSEAQKNEGIEYQ